MSVKPHFHFVTLFPETIHPWMAASIIGRAHKSGLFDYTVHQLRDFSEDKHRNVDDVAYGGGGGMVLKPEPLVKAVETIREHSSGVVCRTVCFTPAGKRFDQHVVESLSPLLTEAHFILICGHYEGIDQRFIDGWADEVISLGDFVLTGGEIPALAFADALIRQLEGTVGHDSKGQSESFTLKDESGNRLLEYPHYTRPSEFRGRAVPEVLLNGDHQAIQRWRIDKAKELTRGRSS